jgi:thioesterase domain-containing protein
VQVISRVRQVLEVEVALGALFTRPVLKDFARGLREGRAEEADAAAGDTSPAERGADLPIPVRATGSETPLFLVHDGDGSIQYAHVLAWQIGAEIPVHALPPLLDDACSLRTVPDMAARLVRMIQSVQPAGPYRIAGWSFGGLLAYEVAAQLIGRNQAVEFLGLIDTPWPNAGRRDAEAPRPSLAQLRRILGMNEGSEPALREFVSTSDLTELDALLRAGHQAGLFPGPFSAEEVVRLRQAVWIYPPAQSDYAPPRLPIPVSYFRATQGSGTDACDGWRALLTDASLRVTPVPGTHWSMMEPDHIPVLGEALTREIACATKNDHGPAGNRVPAPRHSAAR